MKAINNFILEKLKINKDTKVIKQFDVYKDPIEDAPYIEKEPTSNKDDYIKLLFLSISYFKNGNFGTNAYINLNNILYKDKNAIKNLCDKLRILLDGRATHTYVYYWNDDLKVWTTFALFTRRKEECFWKLDEIKNEKYKFE